MGGVRVGVENDQQVEDAFFAITAQSQQYSPQAAILGVSVQEMVKGGKEVILGMSKDVQFGPLIMFGLGGIYVEVLKDVSFRIAPLSVEDADQMIREINAYPLLRGARGEKPTDIAALRECLLRLSQLVTDNPEILELDINPLIVKPEGACSSRCTHYFRGGLIYGFYTGRVNCKLFGKEYDLPWARSCLSKGWIYRVLL